MDPSSSIAVVVRVRPLSEREQHLLAGQPAAPALFVAEGPSSFLTPQPTPPLASSSGSGGSVRKILKVLDERIVIFDPDESNALAAFQRKNLPPKMGKKVKDIRFCFDRVFDEECGQEEVYEGSAKALVDHVMNGFNSTVFAYGATGCGKTHTISGTLTQPGVIFLIMKDLFARISAKAHDTDFTLSISYLEIYNEQIRDLLAPESGQLHLRESQGHAEVAGLSAKTPTCAQDVVEWITIGNANRTVNATEANATSSRSHAVLRITVAQRPRGGGLTDSESIASLSVIDLAGSERAAVTKNKGDRLIEGANINRSLLALGNCIHALCDPKKRNHVPFRDSKLTRLLKPSLGGNCRTVMIVCVSPSSQHYDETHNTLQYANRAKEIKTKAIRNVISVDRHVAQYCQQIMEQTQVIEQLRHQLKTRSDSANATILDDESRECESAKQRLLRMAQRDRVVSAAQAQVELAVIEHILGILRQWRSQAFGEYSGGCDLSDAQATCLGVVKNLDMRAAKLKDEVAGAAGCMSAYDAERASLIRAFHSKPLLSKLFSLELKALDAELHAKVASAKGTAARAATQVQAQAVYAILDAKSKVTKALVESEGDAALVELDSQMTAASQVAFTALCGSLPSPAFVETANMAASWSSLKRTPSKIDAGSMDIDDAPIRKAARASFAPPPVPSSSIRPVTTFARRSPKKGVVFNPLRALKSPAAAKQRKAKTVAWRDEAMTDGELEDVKPDTPSFSVDSPMISIESPSETLSSMTPPAIANASATPWSSLSPNPILEANANSANVASAAERMSSLLKQRSAVHKPLRSVSAGSAKPLPPVSETPAFSFLHFDPSPAADTSLSSANDSLVSTTAPRRAASFSMASTSTGLYAPLSAETMPSTLSSSTTTAGTVKKTTGSLTPRKAARRTSSIGPLRSAKATRRISLSNGTSAATTSTSTAGRGRPSLLSVSMPAHMSIAPAKRTISPRKLSLASRPSFAGPLSTVKGRSSLLPPLVPGGGGDGRDGSKKKQRASLAPTPMSGVVPGSIFGGGGNAALRAAARRTSSAPSGPLFGNDSPSNVMGLATVSES